MSVKYCSCGHRHEWVADAPRHCSNCGKVLNEHVAIKQIAKPSRSKQSIAHQHDEQIDGAEDADKEVPQIDKIEVEIETGAPQKIKFGNARQSMSFAREKQTKQLTVDDLEKRLDTPFERDRQIKD